MTDTSTFLKTTSKIPEVLKSDEATAETWLLQKRNLGGQNQAVSQLKKSVDYERAGGG